MQPKARSLVELLPLSKILLGEKDVFAGYRDTRIGTLIRCDNDDAFENVGEKLTLLPFPLFRPYTKSPSWLKVGNIRWNYRDR